MARPRALVLCGDGINCDYESEYALTLSGFEASRMHVSALLEQPRALADSDICLLPGGFSYGDEIASGKVLGVKLKERLNESLQNYIDKGKMVLGICNGFQVLVQMGLLPESDANKPRTVSLLRNTNRTFLDRWVSLDVSLATNSPFFRGLNKIELPVRHGEGRLSLEPSASTAMEEHDPANPVPTSTSPHSVTADLVRSRAPLRYSEDVNGSFDRIAALTNNKGNVLGMMPHPEAFVRWTQHPAWTERKAKNGGTLDKTDVPDGLKIFQNAAHYVIKG